MSLTYTDEFQSYQITEEALHDPTFLKTLIALGLDPLNGTGPRACCRRCDLDYHRTHRRQHAERQDGLHRRRAPGERRRAAPGRLRLRGSDRARDASTPRSVRPRGARVQGARRIDRRAERRQSRRPVLPPLLARRRHQPARLGTVRRRAALRRDPDRRPHDDRKLGRAPRPGRGQPQRRGVHGRRQRLEQRLGLQPERPALRRRVRACAT